MDHRTLSGIIKFDSAVKSAVIRFESAVFRFGSAVSSRDRGAGWVAEPDGRSPIVSPRKLDWGPRYKSAGIRLGSAVFSRHRGTSQVRGTSPRKLVANRKSAVRGN